MNVTQALDQAVARIANVSSSDGTNATLRARFLEYLNEVVQDFIGSYDFSWLSKRTTLTVSSGSNSTALPANFGGLGDFGGVYLASTGEELDYADPDEMQDIQEDPSSATSAPRKYSIYAEDPILDNSLATVDYSELLQVPTASGNVSLVLRYKATVPTLDESTNLYALLIIPVRYHQTVLMAGLRALGGTALGDGRVQTLQLDSAYNEAKRRATAEDIKGRNQGYAFPSFYGDN